MTLTLEKPETGARLLRFAQKRGIPLDDLIEGFLDDAEEEEEDDYKLTAEDIQALREGAADSDAGRVSDGHANMARRFEKLKQRSAQGKAA
jgi:hypothetical protein